MISEFMSSLMGPSIDRAADLISKASESVVRIEQSLLRIECQLADISRKIDGARGAPLWNLDEFSQHVRMLESVGTADA